MAVRVAINGFGRIGRIILRAIAESGRKDIEVVGINDLGPVETNAHLLRFDSVHGRFPGTVTVEGDSISVGSGKIKVSAERDPSKLPWKELCVDVALECTGIFTARDKAAAHLIAGALRPDVALVDVQMPGGGARTAVRGIAEASPETAVVVLSGDESDSLVRELMIAGAMTYVRKGIAPHELAAVLHRAIRARPLCQAPALV